MRWIIVLVGMLTPVSLAAQEAETVYMGIDLTAEPQPVVAEGEPAPDQRQVDGDMRPILDEGVELGCLSFEPPAAFSQTDNDSTECREYIARLTAATAQAAPERPEDAEADVVETDNPLRAIPLATLARAAQNGNKQAQLELGIRFEEGIGGVTQNWDYALELYSQAGRATPARRGFRVNREAEPGQGGSLSQGQVSRRIAGLPEARERRDALRERMQARDQD